MMVRTTLGLPLLYHEDETAWLELMAQLVAENRHHELDYDHLGEYLTDMARRDRREVYSRLAILLTHLLKWEYQPERRSGSWRGTILEQRSELHQLLRSGTLRNHAIASLAEAYQDARRRAAAETEWPIATFPEDCSWSVEDLTAQDPEDEPT